MTRLSLGLLGPMQITLGGQPVVGFAYNKARALLAYLAVEAGRTHHRDALAALLWPDVPDEAARHNLRQALTNLRTAIGDTNATPAFLVITRDTIQFNPASDYDLDVSRFTALLAACETHAHRRLERCRSCAAQMAQALTLYHGDFLAGFVLGDSAPFEEWLLRHRERLHQRALDALACLAGYHERRGDDELARQYAQRRIDLDAWREEAHRQLMRLLARDGQRSAALAQYENCRRILARDLRAEPEAETTALYERIRDGASFELEVPSSELSGRGHETQTADFRTQNVLNFPAQTSLLIGREAELAELGVLLENPAHRLITIVGPGGIGKTRLALSSAAEQAEAFAQGAVFVPLAGISSAEFLASAIMASLGVGLQGQRDPREQLLDYLRAKEVLLVLDNFEQLLAPEQAGDQDAAGLVVDILQRAPGVTLLVTSRERLALPGEWLFDLSGLSYPAGETINSIEVYGAVQLFMQRARQVRRQFVLADAEIPAVARICRLVEGLPLAIELAAATLRTHSCRAVADAIETNSMALASGLRAVPKRHRSIWATFEHSWLLLSNEERQVFARLSVFRGGFEEQAAAEVAQASPHLLAALLDKSLLRWDGAARYDMHELVRQYAEEQLRVAGEMDQTRSRHLMFFLALAEAAEPKLVGMEQITWMDRLDIEHDNVRAALSWALEHSEGVSAQQLSGAMGEFWEARGYWSEGRQWLKQALALSPETDSSSNSASAEPGGPVRALHYAGALAWRQCDFASASELLERSLTLYRMTDNPDALTRVLGHLGGLAFEQGEYVTAQARYEEGLALQRAAGNPVWLSLSLFCVGLVTFHQGEYAAARTLLEESLKLARAEGSVRSVTYPLNALGNIANLQGDYAAAQAYYEECLTLRRKLAYKRGIATTLADVANLRVKLGQYTTARALYKESLTLYLELGNKRGLLTGLSGLASLAQAQGQLLMATRLQSAVDAPLVQIGIRLAEPQHSDMQRAVAAIRAQLDQATFTSAWAEGRAMTLEQAIVYALDGGAASSIDKMTS